MADKVSGRHRLGCHFGAWLALSAAAVALMQGVAAQSGDPVTMQLVLTGNPGGNFTAFVQLRGAPLDITLPTLYASQQFLAASPYVLGLKLLPYEGNANPEGALLVLENSPIEVSIVDSFFYQLPAPALAVVNSTLRIDNSQMEQNNGGGRVLTAVDSSIAVTDSSFQGAAQDGDGGVFHVRSSMLDFKNATFSSNAASGHGGAIYADMDSKVTGSLSTFANNTAGGHGGAIYHTGFFPSMSDTAGGDAQDCGAQVSAFSAARFAFTNVSFIRNSANSGGAIHQEYVSGNAAMCTFSGNSANSTGGGIAQASAFAELAESEFYGNTAFRGGAMHQANSQGGVSGCMFAGNHAGETGGAIARQHTTGDVNSTRFAGNVATKGGSLSMLSCVCDNVRDSEFADGQASDAGGGMLVNDTTLGVVDNSAFAGLSAQDGAAIYAEGASLGAISNTVFTGGTASADGGALAFKDSMVMQIMYDTFANNTAARGGAISALTSTTTIVGTRFTNNTAAASGPNGAALFSDGGQVTLGVGNLYEPSTPNVLSISKR